MGGTVRRTDAQGTAPWVRAGFLGWSLAFAIVTAVLGDEALATLVNGNGAAKAMRATLVAVPLSVGGLAAAGAFAVHGLLPARRPFLGRCLQLWSPVLALWPLPTLLARTVWSEHPLPFMVVLGLVGLGLLRTLPRMLSAAEPWGRKLRLSRAPALVSRSLLLVATAGFALFGAFGSVRVHHKMLTSTFDLGLFENLFFNTLAGRHGVAVEIPYFGQHAEFLLYALVPFYKVFPSAETLLALQALFMAGTAVPIYLIARRYMGDGGRALGLALVYLAYPAVHGPLFFDFHFLALSGFFLAWAAYFLLRRSKIAFWVALVLAMSCREDVALGVALVALGSVVADWPRKRLALVVAVVGVAWFGFLKFYWMQLFLKNTFSPYYADLIPEGQRGFAGVGQTLLSNPLYAFNTLLRADKLLLALQLFVPLAFVPLLRPRLWPLALPGFVVVGLATSHGAILQINFHYITHFVPYVFVAACLVLAVQRSATQRAAVMAMLVLSLVATHRFGAFFADRFKTSFHEVSFDWTEEDETRWQDFTAIARHIPPDASVAAGEHEGPHLAARRHMVSLKYGIRDYDFAITSQRSLRWGGRDHLKKVLREGTYGVVEQRGDFLLLQRGLSAGESKAGGLRFLSR